VVEDVANRTFTVTIPSLAAGEMFSFGYTAVMNDPANQQQITTNDSTVYVGTPITDPIE
jgi:hypothetical protein